MWTKWWFELFACIAPHLFWFTWRWLSVSRSWFVFGVNWFRLRDFNCSSLFMYLSGLLFSDLFSSIHLSPPLSPHKMSTPPPLTHSLPRWQSQSQIALSPFGRQCSSPVFCPSDAAVSWWGHLLSMRSQRRYGQQQRRSGFRCYCYNTEKEGESGWLLMCSLL
jgi:hypothetical protein